MSGQLNAPSAQCTGRCSLMLTPPKQSLHSLQGNLVFTRASECPSEPRVCQQKHRTIDLHALNSRTTMTPTCLPRTRHRTSFGCRHHRRMAALCPLACLLTKLAHQDWHSALLHGVRLRQCSTRRAAVVLQRRLPASRESQPVHRLARR